MKAILLKLIIQRSNTLKYFFLIIIAMRFFDQNGTLQRSMLCSKEVKENLTYFIIYTIICILLVDVISSIIDFQLK